MIKKINYIFYDSYDLSYVFLQGQDLQIVEVLIPNHWLESLLMMNNNRILYSNDGKSRIIGVIEHYKDWSQVKKLARTMDDYGTYQRKLVLEQGTNK